MGAIPHLISFVQYPHKELSLAPFRERGTGAQRAQVTQPSHLINQKQNQGFTIPSVSSRPSRRTGRGLLLNWSHLLVGSLICFPRVCEPPAVNGRFTFSSVQNTSFQWYATRHDRSIPTLAQLDLGDNLPCDPFIRLVFLTQSVPGTILGSFTHREMFGQVS